MPAGGYAGNVLNVTFGQRPGISSLAARRCLVILARMDPVPHFDVPLNLPHAGRVARRLVTFLHRDGHGGTAAAATAAQIVERLDPYFESEENPTLAAARPVRDEVAALGRLFVEQIELDALGHDRLGQAVRNLFECLELGEEGAGISLRAGENPHSMQRPS